MPAQAKWVNNSPGDMNWLMEWSDGNSQARGDMEPVIPPAPEDTFICTFRGGTTLCGFELTRFTGQAVALISDGRYSSSLLASTNMAASGAAVAGTDVQWNNYTKSQTVQWVTVGINGPIASGSILPGGQVTQGLQSGVTQVGFQFNDFTGVMASAFGSTTLTAQLNASDS